MMSRVDPPFAMATSLIAFAAPGELNGTVTQRVHLPNNWVLGFRVIVFVVQVLDKYIIIRYLDP